MIKHAYMYGLELAAKEAGYSSWEEFYKQADALGPAATVTAAGNIARNGLIGTGLGAALGIGAGALMADDDQRLRGALIGGLGGAAAGGLLGSTGTAIGQHLDLNKLTEGAQSGMQSVHKNPLIGAGIGLGGGALLGAGAYELQPDVYKNDPNSLSRGQSIALNALSGGMLGSALGNLRSLG